MDFNIFKNKIIVFEGLDETGKSSVLDLFVRDLKDHGINFIKTKQPGADWGNISPTVYSLCKDRRWKLSSRGNLFAFLLDRAECTEKILKPAISSGKTIVTDRWSYSTIAYQFYGKGMIDEFLEELGDTKKVDIIMEFLTSAQGIEPNFVFYFSQKVGRREKNLYDNFDNSGDLFENRVKRGYETIKENFLNSWVDVSPGNSAEDTLSNIYSFIDLEEKLI